MAHAPGGRFPPGLTRMEGGPAPAGDREQVKRLLQDRGLLGELPATLTAQARPLAAEELEELASKAAQGGPVSTLMIKEWRGEL